MFTEVAKQKEDYNKKYNKLREQFGKCLKLVVHEVSTHRTKVADLMRYRIPKLGNEQISFKEYVDRMKEGHKTSTTNTT